MKLPLLFLTAVTAIGTTEAQQQCEERTFADDPTVFSIQQYKDARTQCNNLCNANGYCCTGGSGLCAVLPCNTGCHIAFYSQDVTACKAECARGNMEDSTFYFFKHVETAAAGFDPVQGVNKFQEAEQCGCSSNGLGPDCAFEACAAGCDFANDPSVRNSLFKGPNAFVDEQIGQSKPDLMASLSALRGHVDGTSPLSQADINNAATTFKANSRILDFEHGAMVQAFDLVDAYESKFGPLFIGARSEGGFPRSPVESDDDFALERAIMAVMQGLLDEVYQGTPPDDNPVQSTPVIVGICQDFLRGRFWRTSSFFPGFVDLPSNPSAQYTVTIDATMSKFYGIKVCFADEYFIRPTGFYLSPGGVAAITVPQALVGKEVQVQVGASNADHTFKEFHSRVERITSTYTITSTVTYVANPLGGGIYIKIPHLMSEGIVDITISGDVIRAPFYSDTNLKKTTRAEWDAVKSSPAPWADFVTNAFFMQIPSIWFQQNSQYDFDYLVNLMSNRERAMRAVNYLLGVPDELRNNYVLYLQPDLQIRAEVYGVGYPQVNQVLESGPNGVVNDPSHVLIADPFLSETFDGTVEYHELGHCVSYPYYPGEVEAVVNFLFAHVGSTEAGLSFNDAFAISSSDFETRYTPDLAAMEWMTTEQFRNGQEMLTNADGVRDQFGYQQRGYAKYADVYQVFGVDALRRFYGQQNALAEEGTRGQGEDLPESDYLTLHLSIAAGFDLTPLIHFWGIHPTDEGKDELKSLMASNNLQVSNEVRALIERRIAAIPQDNAAFRQFAIEVRPEINDLTLGTEKCPEIFYGCGYYLEWQNRWNSDLAGQTEAAGRALIAMYYPDVDDNECTPFTARDICNRALDGNTCTWRGKVLGCWRRADMTCVDYTNESRCVLHGDQCVYGKNGEGCFDPCTGKGDRESCNRVPNSYCTWRKNLKECWFRYKMECSFYENGNRCLTHGAFCNWVTPAGETEPRCIDQTEPSDSPEACNVYVSRKLCIRDPFDICAWDNTAPALDGNGLGACARKDTMPCSGNIDERFCSENPRCFWTGSNCIENVN